MESTAMFCDKGDNSSWTVSVVFLSGEIWVLPAQNTLRMNEYFSGFQPRYMEGTGQELSCTAILRPQLVLRLIMIIMIHS